MGVDKIKKEMNIKGSITSKGNEHGGSSQEEDINIIWKVRLDG